MYKMIKITINIPKTFRSPILGHDVGNSIDGIINYIVNVNVNDKLVWFSVMYQWSQSIFVNQLHYDLEFSLPKRHLKRKVFILDILSNISTGGALALTEISTTGSAELN